MALWAGQDPSKIPLKMRIMFWQSKAFWLRQKGGDRREGASCRTGTQVS